MPRRNRVKAGPRSAAARFRKAPNGTGSGSRTRLRSSGYGEARDDEDDLVLLATAIEGKAEVFMTGDRAVQSVGYAVGMKILGQRQFWEKLVGQQGD